MEPFFIESKDYAIRERGPVFYKRDQIVLQFDESINENENTQDTHYHFFKWDISSNNKGRERNDNYDISGLLVQGNTYAFSDILNPTKEPQMLKYIKTTGDFLIFGEPTTSGGRRRRRTKRRRSRRRNRSKRYNHHR